MTLQYVTLVLDAYDAQGNIVTKGSAAFVQSVQLTDPGVEWIPPAPIPAVFRAGAVPSVKLLSTDSTDALPNGWTWAVTFSGVPGDPAGFSFFLPHSGGATQYLSALADVPAVTPMAQYLPLSGGTMTGNTGVPVKSVTTTNVTAITDVVTLCSASGGAFVNTLPDATAVPAGAPYLFKKTDATSNEVTLMPVSSQKIDGAPYLVLAVPNTAATLRSDGTQWWAL